MSVKLMAEVWDLEDRELKESKLLMLLALADHANEDGICWPALPRLAQRARISTRHAARVIEWLAERGHIEVISKGNGRGNSTIYRVTPNRTAGLEKGDIGDKKDDIGASQKGDIGDKKGDIGDKKGDIGDIKGDIAMSPEPSIEPSIEPSREPSVSRTRPQAGSAGTHPNTKPILDAYLEVLGYEPASYGREAKAAKHLATRGYEPADVVAAYQMLKGQPFWRAKHLSLQTIASEIPALAHAMLNGQPIPTGRPTSKVDAVMDAVDDVFDMIEQQGGGNG